MAEPAPFEVLDRKLELAGHWLYTLQRGGMRYMVRTVLGELDSVTAVYHVAGTPRARRLWARRAGFSEHLTGVALAAFEAVAAYAEQQEDAHG